MGKISFNRWLQRRAEGAGNFVDILMDESWLETLKVPPVEGVPGPEGPQGPPGAQGPPGVGMIWFGPWSSVTAYLEGDGVESNGTTYIAIAPNLNSQPPNANWDVVAAKGLQGDAGPAGAPGNNGANGATGPQGNPGPNEVTGATATTLTGLLKGTGTVVTVASAPTDYVATGDSRLTDARTPTAHTHPESDITNLVADLAAKESAANKGAASGYAGLDGSTKVPIAQIPTGSSATTVCIGDDARLSDTRTPTSHASTHVTGGSDVIANAAPGGNAGLMTGADKTKLDGIAAGAEVNVNADWNAGSGDALILNKPTLGSLAAKNTIATADIDNDAVTFAKLQNVSATDRFLGRKTAGAGDVEELTGTEATARLNVFTSALNGLVPASGGGTTNFLRADGTFAAPPAGGGITTLKTTGNQTINGGAGVFVDVTGLTFPVVNGVDYAFTFYVTFRSAQGTTGWKAGVNCPTGTLDFWAGSPTIANGAAGVATHTERHNVTRDDMTLLTATVTAGVDLSVRIEGRYLCTANGTFAVRFANELASNTDVVVQKGSWGFYF